MLVLFKISWYTARILARTAGCASKNQWRNSALVYLRYLSGELLIKERNWFEYFIVHENMILRALQITPTQMKVLEAVVKLWLVCPFDDHDLHYIKASFADMSDSNIFIIHYEFNES